LGGEREGRYFKFKFEKKKNENILGENL